MRIWAEEWRSYEQELEGWLVSVTCYCIGRSYITQVESSSSGALIAREIAATREDSERQALEMAKERLFLTRRIELMVGG
ncbi:MAG: hypothetical protein JO182_17490 [Acidobacteriaceae bacterium]|nr:hypothetical protein [Acidobacteriaceae bacterium]MBV9225439.1 hypothetical protein [Acidobacteriaceae bacterium]MBV9304611.1 hypothetical protein [Acidobacteriaceae bacterium]